MDILVNEAGIITQTAWRIFPDCEYHGSRLSLSLGHSGLGFVSDFDIRVSDLTAKLL
jgi:hypothetical protein